VSVFKARRQVLCCTHDIHPLLLLLGITTRRRSFLFKLQDNQPQPYEGTEPYVGAKQEGGVQSQLRGIVRAVTSC